MKFVKRIAGIAAAAALAFSTFTASFLPEKMEHFTASAAEETYPVQKFRLGIGDTNRNVNSNSAQLNSQLQNGTNNEKWSLNYISEGVYEIVSAETGYVITNSDGNCVLAPDTDASNQRWNITAVEQDFEEYDLYYKITSHENSSLAMTFQPEGNFISTDNYSGNIYQKFKLNLDGLEGYAANASIGGKEKAGTIGGLLGETVFVDTTEELVAAMKKTVPLTIVITGDCDFVNWSKEDQKIEDDKTILGSYSKNTVYDTQWRNDDFWGDVSKPPSNNIVIQNVNLVARSLNSSGSGVILVYIYCGRNVWIDHCDFSATFGHNRDVEVGKFLWINTPSAGWSDGCYNGINPDYITVSYNHFNNRYWTVAYGSQNSDTSRVRTTLMYNYWQQCARRTPQIGNGTGHIYNNFYTFSGSGGSDQIIGGDGSNILSENCRFEGLSGFEIEGGGSSSSPYTDSGSYTASNSSSTPSALNHKSKYSSSLKPSDSYGYSLIKAYDSSGNDTKKFCQTYAGCFKNDGGIKFITDSDMSGWINKKHDCPFLKDITVTDAKPGTVMSTDAAYVFENANSGLYLEVAGGEAASGANVQQGSTGAAGWKLVDAGEGYYYVYSEVGDGQTYCLDLNFGDTANGTNVGIWTNDESDARKFKFIANGDGTYAIVTKSTKDASGLGVESASTEEGANVLQWKCNDSADQKWIAKIRMYGELISEVLVDSNAYLDGWSFDNSIAAGDAVFADRDVTYTTLPIEIDGAEALIVDCDAKNVTSDLAVLTAGDDIALYVGMDERVNPLPTWLSEWTDTGLTAVNNKGVNFRLYKRDMNAGDQITLGTNGQSSSCVNYTVFAVKAAEARIKGNVNADGEFSVIDIVQMQKYLLGTGSLIDWQAGDVCEDGVIDAFDLAIMKRMLLQK